MSRDQILTFVLLRHNDRQVAEGQIPSGVIGVVVSIDHVTNGAIRYPLDLVNDALRDVESVAIAPLLFELIVHNQHALVGYKKCDIAQGGITRAFRGQNIQPIRDLFDRKEA